MKNILYVVVLMLIAGCKNDQAIYTLYRDGLSANNRIHIATFDAKEKGFEPTIFGEYNQGNCELVRTLLQNQPNVMFHFWCEKGNFKK